MREMIFVLTDKCNLNCTQCYKPQNNISKTLSAEFLKEKIRTQMLADDGCNVLWVDLFGGEPLMEFSKVREVIEWFAAAPWPSPVKSCRFLVETNGTLLDDSMMEWFSKYRHFVVLGLNLHRIREAHDGSLSAAYSSLISNSDFFRRNWPEQPVKMTIGPHSVDQAYEGALNIHGLGLRAEFDIAREDVWGDAESESRAVRTWAGQLDKLAGFYSARPGIQRPTVLSRKLELLFSREKDEKRTFCGAGKYVISYTPEGIENPCFRVAPIAVNEPLHDVFTAPVRLQNEQCAICPLEKICTTCEGHNYSMACSCFKMTNFHCRFFKASLLACAKLLQLDHPGDLSEPPESRSKEEQLQRMRRLMAIRAVNDLCASAVYTDNSP